MRYAANTIVSADKSRAEIERCLVRYGATGFTYGWQGSMAVIGFEAKNRRVAFFLPMPDKTSKEFTHTAGKGQRRTQEAGLVAWEQACRQRWRALALAVKAKLEAVEAHITTFDDEFLAHMVLPNGKTVGQTIQPQLEMARSSGKMPPLLGFSK